MKVDRGRSKMGSGSDCDLHKVSRGGAAGVVSAVPVRSIMSAASPVQLHSNAFLPPFSVHECVSIISLDGHFLRILESGRPRKVG